MAVLAAEQQWPADEEWRSVIGYEGLYEVSAAGRVRRAAGSYNTLLPRLLKPMSQAGDYLRMTLSRDDEQRSVLVHQLVAAAFIGPRPAGAQINHISGIKHDNAACNLEYCTPAENAIHAARLGLTPSGERHHAAKVSNATVTQACAEYRQGGSTYGTLARKYGVSYDTVRLWVLGKVRRDTEVSG